jgi:2-deoxy-D-gluconate 3-dehydrogenase
MSNRKQLALVPMWRLIFGIVGGGPLALIPAHAASKGAIGSLTRALANEWASRGVQVNAIAPGYIATDLNAVLREDPQRLPAISERIPAGRWGTPADLKGPVIFLASAASDSVNGEVLVVDGGWMAR